MPDLEIPYQMENKIITFTLFDNNTGGFYNLTNLTATLKISTTDYISTLLTKTLTITNATGGTCTWTPSLGDWGSISNANQAYFGQIIVTASNTQIASFQFDIRIYRMII